MELGRHDVDGAGQVGVGPQLELLLYEVVVGLGELELGLSVLSDQHEG
jgi:hypothetical protein